MLKPSSKKRGEYRSSVLSNNSDSDDDNDDDDDENGNVIMRLICALQRAVVRRRFREVGVPCRCRQRCSVGRRAAAAVALEA